jgi:cation diffusion facilitator family transporter
MIALLIGYESVLRLLQPVAIRFDEAILIAVVGLMVNLGSAWLLRAEPEHEHEHADHGHHHHAHDHNLRSAYFHVLADALTSVLAIAALLAGRLFGWAWMDPIVGIVGAVVIGHWSGQLLRSSGAVLLDIVPNGGLATRIRQRLEQDGDRVADLHFWRLGPGHVGVIVSVVSDRPEAPGHYKARLAGLVGLSHVTVEVHSCQGPGAGVPIP